MKKKMLKSLSVFLVVLVVLSIAPLNTAVVEALKNSTNNAINNIGTALSNIEITLPDFNLEVSAAKDKSESFQWYMSGNTLNISGDISMDSFSAEKTRPGWENYKDQIEVVVVKGKVSRIGAYAFYNYTNLKEVQLIGNVTGISRSAFEGCTSLEIVKTNNTIQSISINAFKNCTALKTITNLNSVVYIYDYAFQNDVLFCEDGIVLPNTLEYVGFGAFNGCNFKSMTTPFVGAGPKNDSDNRTDFIGFMFGADEYENSYRVDKSYYYYRLPVNLKTVIITKNLYKDNFSDAYEIEKIVISEDVVTESIPGVFAKNCTGLKEIEINSSTIKTIGNNAFSNCSELTRIVIPESVTIVGEYAFAGDSALSEVVFPQTDFSVYRSAFEGTRYINNYEGDFLIVGDGVLINYKGVSTDVTIPDTVKRISCPFDMRNDITSIKIPESVLYISYKSFFGCEKVTELSIPESVQVIEQAAFSGMCSLEKLTVYFIGRSRNEKSDSKYSVIGYWFQQSSRCSVCSSTRCREICQSLNNGKSKWYSYKPYTFTTLVIKDSVIKKLCLNKFNISVVHLGADVKGFEEDAFKLAGIKELYFDENIGVTEIPDGAFYGNNFKTVTIPSRVKKIGAAFVHCGLTEVNLNEGLEIIDGSFASTKIKKIEFPSTLKEISGDAFAYCESLTNISFGENIELISKTSFDKSKVKSFSVSENNKNYFSEYGVVYNKDGEMVLYPQGSTETVFRVSEKVTSLDKTVLENLQHIETFVVEESNKHYFSCEGVLYTADGALYVYPSASAATVFKVGEKVTSLDKTVLENLEYIEIFVVEENNKHYFSCEGVLYTADGALYVYPSASKATIFKIDERVTSLDKCTLENLKDIKAFIVEEENKHYFSSDGVLYTSDGVMFVYPRNRTTKTFKLNARVSSIPITDDLFDNISEFIVDEKNKFYKSIDGVLYDKDVTILYRFPAAKTGCDYIAPKTLKCVESYAFKNVVGLGTVEFRSEVKFSYLCFYKASFNKLVAENIPRALIDYFGGNNKAYCSNDLKTLVLTNQTSDIPDYFAYNCSLESVSINGTIKSVGVYAFKMNEITELVLPDSVKELKKGSFNQCVKLSVVKFGESLECVGEEAFYGCPLKSVELPVGLKTIGDWAFAFTGIEYVEFPESVTSIGKCAFSGSEIKKTVINENLAGITNEVFQNCTNLEIVVVGSNVKNIGALAFENCASLSTIIIPDNVLSIDSTAFTNANDELVIYCNEGSYAQTYATNNNMKYTTLVLSAIPNQSYTGKEIEPQVSVFANGKELVLDSQYKLTFSDNINVGTAKLTARGLGDFKHLVAKGQFEILPRQLSDVVIIYNDFTYYQPIGTKLNLNLYADDNKLTEGEDYEILNWNAGNGVGIYNVTVKGINNILGTYNFTVEVLPRSITVTKITKTGDFKVTDSKYTLVEGVDYNVEVRTDEKGNEETCFVGIGNYTDEKMYSESQRDSTSFISVIMNLLSKLLSGLFNIF